MHGQSIRNYEMVTVLSVLKCASDHAFCVQTEAAFNIPVRLGTPGRDASIKTRPHHTPKLGHVQFIEQ